MISKNNCFYLGKITKSVGLKGEVQIYFDVDSTDYYSNLESVFVDINNKLVPFFIDKITFNHSNTAKVKIEGLNHIDDTDQFIGKDLYLPLEFLPKLAPDQFYYHEITDFKVIFDNQIIGKIVDVIDNKFNPLFSILNEDNKEILIPVNDNYLISVDKPNKQIIVDLPEGYLDIYL